MKIISMQLTPKNRQLASTTQFQLKPLMTIVRAVPRSTIIIRNALLRTIAQIAIMEKDDQGDKGWGLHLLNQSYQKNKVNLRVVALPATMLKERKKRNCQNQTLNSVSYLSSFRSWK